MKPIGILGGTFDPIHYGHLRLAEEALNALSLDQVRLIPTGNPWHRTPPAASAAQRVQMARLACAGNARLVVDDREAASQAPGYTVDTLASLRAEFGAAQPLCLLLGADAFLGLDTWHRWENLFELAHIAVAQRPGFALDSMRLPVALQAQWAARHETAAHALASSAAGRILDFEITALDISATRIRTEIAADHSPRYLLPETVFDYIAENHLYHA